MNKEQKEQDFNLIDAFIALDALDDEDVKGMIHEGKSFGVFSSDLAEAKKFLEEEASEVELEVIDADADAMNHLKSKEDYIGQAIITCRKCLAPTFIDMDKLVPSDDDPEIYNIELECPNCHAEGSGFELIGQAGKVTKQESSETESEESTEAEATEETSDEENNNQAAIDNDQSNNEEATFDNDLEEVEAENTESEDADLEEVEVDDTLDDEEDDDGMETDESEEDEDEEDIPKLGDEYEESFEEDEEDKVPIKEELNKYAAEAWLMNKVISSMNNEDAYFGGWLYIWPDGESREECAYDFGDKESFDELRDSFIRNYRRYHSDGLFEPDDETIAYAQKQDELLGLRPIDILRRNPKPVREALDQKYAADLFSSIIEPENIKTIVVYDVSDDKADPRVVFEGSFEDIPANINPSDFKAFNAADGHFVCNVDLEDTECPTCLDSMLGNFCDEDTDKISIWDVNSCDEVFCGNKKDALDRYGKAAFVSFDAPAVLRVYIDNSGLLSKDELEGEEVTTDLDKLVANVIKANNLSEYKVNNSNTNEYWINECIRSNDDLDIIYEKFVKDLDEDLVREFKEVTGFKDELDKAIEKSGKKVEVVKDNLSEADEEAENDSEDKEKVEADDKSDDEAEAKEIIGDNVMAMQKTSQPVSGAPARDYISQADQAALDKLATAVIDLEKNESIRSFKSRKNLSEAINIFKNNNTPYSIRRSKTEGFRYDLITEAFFEDEKEVVEPDEIVTAAEVEEIPTETPDSTDLTPANMTDAERDVLNRISDVSRTIADAIKEYYDIDADPRLIVADIIQDLRLISGAVRVEDLEDTPINRVTAQMYDSYNNFYAAVDELVSELTGESVHTTPEQKFTQALQALNSPAFGREAIFKGIGSQKFLTAVQNGSIPYIDANEVPRLHEALQDKQGFGVCPACGCDPCECKKECVTEAKEDDVEDSAEEDVESVTQLAITGREEALDVLEDNLDIEVTDDSTLVVSGKDASDDAAKVEVEITDDEKEILDTELDANAAADAALEQTDVSDDVELELVDDKSEEASDEELEEDYQYKVVIKGSDDAITTGSSAECYAWVAEHESDGNDYEVTNCSECVEALEVDFDTDEFDADVNEYFNEAYEDTVVYTTVSGSVDDKGVVILEGVINNGDTDSSITFTLTPKETIHAQLSEGHNLNQIARDTAYVVTNNLSEEKFEFNFSKENIAE